MKFDRLAIHALALLALAHAPHPFQRTSNLFALAEDAAPDDAKIQVEDTYNPPENAENYAFEAEVSRMLDIVVNSLYQNKDVFLRELISNASDALDKVRFLSLTKPEFLDTEEKLQIQIEFDNEANTLTVRDTGIGMTKEDLVANLGTVARSGTTRFLEALKDKGDSAVGGVSQIGQFGVGFYSAFLVSDRVQVASKHPDSEQQWVWTSGNGAAEFQIFPDPRGATLSRGTEITLYLKEDCMEYADQYRLDTLAKHYSEFVVHPIYLRTFDTVEVEVEDDEDVAEGEEKSDDGDDDLEVSDDEDEEAEKPKKTKQVTTMEWEHLNGSPAIWTRPKEDITEDEYQSFFKLIAKDDMASSVSHTHFQAEGNINFKSILYMPQEVPPQWQQSVTEPDATGLSLYVQKVLISDTFDLLPRYLGFIKGVVDSDDLPLNVNRETLQESKIIQIIKKKLVRKALEMMKKFISDSESGKEIDENEDLDEEEKEAAKADAKKELGAWMQNFSPALKIGAIEDEPNRGKIMKLLRYKSTKTGKDGWVSLEDYVENMKDWQKDIFFAAAVDFDTAEKMEFLEAFAAKDVEVLYFIDPVDEYVVHSVRSFDGKKLVNVASDGVKLSDEEDKDLATRREKFYKEKFKNLTKWLKKLYGSAIMRVSISNRLVSTPAIASSAEFGHSANMERIMRAQAYNSGQSSLAMSSMKILEINPRHPIILKLLEGAPEESEDDAEVVVDPEIENAALVLLDVALLSGGFPLADTKGYSDRMLKFMSTNLALDSLELAPEPELPEEEEVAPDIDDGPKGTSPEDAIPLTVGEDGHIEL